MESLVKSVLSFTSISSNEVAEAAVWLYVNGEYGIIPLLDKHLPRSKHGADMDILLIVLFIEGEADWFDIPIKPKLGRYSKKEKSIRYGVPVTQESFFSLPPMERKEFILRQVFDAVKAAKKSLGGKGMDIDFDGIESGLSKLVAIYREMPLPE